MKKPWFLLLPLVLAAAISAGDASAAETSITLGDVAVPPVSSGVEHAALRSAAEGELRGVDASHLRKHRKVLVSVAVIGASQSPFACTVNAMLRDATTGTMLAVIEGRAHASGDGKDTNAASVELKNQVMRAAVRVAVRQIPDALAAN
jgi:hypothetical protein